MVSQFCNVFDARFPQLESGEQYEPDIIECGFIEVNYFSDFIVNCSKATKAYLSYSVSIIPWELR